MSEHIYTLDEIFAAVCPLSKKYHAEKAILFGVHDRRAAGAASDIDPTNTPRGAEKICCAVQKPADVYELREVVPASVFYHTITAERMQIV